MEVASVGQSVASVEASNDGRLLLMSPLYTRRNHSPTLLLYVGCSMATQGNSEQSQCYVQGKYPIGGYSEWGKRDQSKFIVSHERSFTVVDVSTQKPLFCKPPPNNANSSVDPVSF